MAADSQPFTSDELAVWAGFLATHSRVTAELDGALQREHGLTIREFEVLLKLAGRHGGGLRLSDLALVVYLTPSGLSRQVDRMESRGLVRRSPDGADQRARCVSITRAGSQLLRRAAAGHRRRVRALFLDRLPERDRTMLARTWRRLDTEA